MRDLVRSPGHRIIGSPDGRVGFFALGTSRNAIEHIVIGGGSSMGHADPAISDAVRIGSLLLLSGRADVDPTTLRVRNEQFAAQAQSVLADVETVLRAAGSSLALVLRVECFLSDARDFGEWNRVWRDIFLAPRPARTTVVVVPTIPGLLIEVNVTAVVAEAGGR